MSQLWKATLIVGDLMAQHACGTLLNEGVTHSAGSAPVTKPTHGTTVDVPTTGGVCTPMSTSTQRITGPVPACSLTADPSALAPPPALTSNWTITGRLRGVAHVTLKGVGAVGAWVRHRKGLHGGLGGPEEPAGPWAITRAWVR